LPKIIALDPEIALVLQGTTQGKIVFEVTDQELCRDTPPVGLKLGA
jgi:hypothetical protein